MSNGIAHVQRARRYGVTLNDQGGTGSRRAWVIHVNLTRQASRGQVAGEAMDAALTAHRTSVSLDDFGGVDLAIEARDRGRAGQARSSRRHRWLRPEALPPTPPRLDHPALPPSDRPAGRLTACDSPWAGVLASWNIVEVVRGIAIEGRRLPGDARSSPKAARQDPAPMPRFSQRYAVQSASCFAGDPARRSTRALPTRAGPGNVDCDLTPASAAGRNHLMGLLQPSADFIGPMIPACRLAAGASPWPADSRATGPAPLVAAMLMLPARLVP